MSEDKALRRARSKLAKALEEGRDAEAIELLIKLRRQEPDNPRWPHKQGDLLRNHRHYAHAARCFEKAVALYAQQGFIARAVAMAKTVVELDPSRIKILERIDPQAAQLLRSQRHASRAALLDREDRSIRPLPLAPSDDPLRRPDPAALRPRPGVRPPPPPPPPPTAARDPSALLGLSAPPRARLNLTPIALSQRPAQGADARGRIHSPPLITPAAPAERSIPAPPLAPRSLRASPPAVPAAALAPPPTPRAVTTTLDQLSLPPLVMQSGPGVRAQESLELIYGRAVRRVPSLAPDPNAPGDETRLSSIPPALRLPPANEAGAPRSSEPDVTDPMGHAGQGSPSDLAAAMAHALSAEADFESALDDLEACEVLDDAVSLSEAELSDRPSAEADEAGGQALPSAARLADLPLFPLFAALPRPVLAHIVAGAELVELADDAQVVRCGDPSDALFGIVEGSVSIVVPGQAFEWTLAEGDVFGEACLLEDGRAQADITVTGRLSALRIPRDVLLDGIREHPPLAALVLSLLTRRLLGNLLQVSALFQDFDVAGKTELARLFEVRRVAAGTLLSEVGKRTDGLYIALTGTLEVRRPGAPLMRAAAGSMFGHNGLLTQSASPIEVVAAVDMMVLRLPLASFTGVAMQHPTVLARLSELSTGDVVRVII